MPAKVFDFFSGCGGTSAGLRQSGMDIVFALDVDEDSAATFQKNFPDATFINEDIRQVQTDRLEALIAQCEDQPLVFAGCAPCQPFSVQNRARKNKDKLDARINLLSEFGRFVTRFLPDYVLVENVPGLQTKMGDEGPFKEFVTLLSELGYAYEARVVRSQDYGVPQRRARLVLIASRHGAIDLPPPTHGLNATPPQPYANAWDAIRHLPPLEAGERHETVFNHVSAALSELNLKRIRATPEGGDRRNWPSNLLLECHKRVDARGTGANVHMDVYGRIRKDQPASGLTTRCISLSNGRFGHPEQDRALSVREAAYLQTFEHDFVFVGTANSTARQVGNAVPVLMAQRIGDHVVHHARLHGLVE
jgi:DNA (cytosine-5)-methyltransferase 1